MVEQCTYYYEDNSLTGIRGKKKAKAKGMIVGMMTISYKVQNKDLNYKKIDGYS